MLSSFLDPNGSDIFCWNSAKEEQSTLDELLRPIETRVRQEDADTADNEPEKAEGVE